MGDEKGGERGGCRSDQKSRARLVEEIGVYQISCHQLGVDIDKLVPCWRASITRMICRDLRGSLFFETGQHIRVTLSMRMLIAQTNEKSGESPDH